MRTRFRTPHLIVCAALILPATGWMAGSSNEPQGEQRFEKATIEKVQQKLKDEGFDPGPIDGIFGPQTHQALRTFQAEEGLQASGRLNRKTLEALGIEQPSGGLVGAVASGTKTAGKVVGSAAATAGKATAKAAVASGKAAAKAAAVTGKAVAKGAKGVARGAAQAADETKDFLVGEDADEKLRKRVESRLKEDERIDTDAIDVRVKDSNVTLHFTGGTRDQWNRATFLTQEVEGVDHVFVRLPGEA